MNPPSQNKLVSPRGKQTRLTAPTGMKVKIRAVTQLTFKEGTNDITVKPGDEVEVDEMIAQEYCDQEIDGYYTFAGERDNGDALRAKIRRAERIKA